MTKYWCIERNDDRGYNFTHNRFTSLIYNWTRYSTLGEAETILYSIIEKGYTYQINQYYEASRFM